MKSSVLIAGAMALGLAVAGCGGDDKKDAAPAGSGTAAAPKPSTTAAANTAAPKPSTAAVAANDDVPSEADFEEEAEKDITADNVEAELDKLEKEIGQ